MEALLRVCKKYKIHSAQVFRWAYEYSETMVSMDKLKLHYLSCCRKDNNGNLQVFTVPTVVEDYCIGILSKRIEMPIKEK